MNAKVTELRAAIIQHPPVYMNLTASLEKAEGLIRQAAEEGARLVVFPETWLPGYPVWLDSAPEVALWGKEGTRQLYRLLEKNSLQLGSEALVRLAEMASENKVYLVMGAHELWGNSLYNSMIFLSPEGKEPLIHRKLMPTFTERLIWGSGDGSGLQTLSTEFGPLGGLICWEHWMPLARAAMHGMREVVHVAQWPGVKDLHQIASRHYAFEGQCFVVAAGTVLTQKDVLEGFDSLRAPSSAARELLASMASSPDTVFQNGGSAFIGPDSNYINQPLFDEVGIITATLDLEILREGHLLMDTDGHYSRPDVFSLTVNREARRSVRFVNPSKEE